jgi:DNA helicase-2/ATP-dependent DNA helicase PcrA
VPAGEGAAYGNGRAQTFTGNTRSAEGAQRRGLRRPAARNPSPVPGERRLLAEYQKKFKYMLVDEYQDTNVAQYLWLRLLAQGHRNICCVGDDDQSIYGWRGAEVDNILRFEKDFPGAGVVRLERNYRSTPHILGAAPGLITHNEGRLGKTLRTDQNEGGEKVKVRGHWDGDEEARAIGEDIEQAQRAGTSLKEVAILVRASFQMRAFEDRFITLGLPYRVVGGPRFYERAGNPRCAGLSQGHHVARQ